MKILRRVKLRLRAKQINFLCHIGHSSRSFHIIGLGCVDKREISGAFRQENEEALSLPYGVCTCEDVYRLRKITKGFDFVSICYQYLNLDYALRNIVRVWRKRFVRMFSDKARNIEERKEKPELHGDEKNLRMMANKDSLYSVFMLRSMYIFKGKYTFTNNFPAVCRLSTY